MLPFKSLALAACVTSIGSLSALAEGDGTGADGFINIYNSTPGYTVVGFYTNAGHGWSKDWLTQDILTPGVGAKAVYAAAPPACHQHVRVGWLGPAGMEVHGHPIHLNICDVSNIYFAENETFYD